jgi:hypothetical protein
LDRGAEWRALSLHPGGGELLNESYDQGQPERQVLRSNFHKLVSTKSESARPESPFF